jgi:hypothetical protein
MNDNPEAEHSEAKAAPRSERDVEIGTTARERCRGSISVSRDLVFAFNEPEDSDFRVIASGVTFYVHRVILKCRSNLFASILRGGFQESLRGELLIDNFPPTDVEAALRWIYTSEVDLTAANLLGVFQVGEYLQLDRLVQQCRDAAETIVTVDSMLDVFGDFATLAEPAINDACLWVWARNAPAIQKPQFLDLRIDALSTFLSHNAANCAEDALFMRVVEWMRTNLYVGYPREAQPVESDRLSGCRDDDASLMPTVLRLLSHIHLAKLSAQCITEAVDLANHVSPFMTVTLVAGIRHQLTQHTGANDASARPRTGAIVFPDSEPRVIEALSSTDEDSELNVVAMQHGIDLLLASAAPNDKIRVVKASWAREATGTLDLTLGGEKFLLIPFPYNSRWRLFTMCRREGRLFLYTAQLHDKEADDPNCCSRRAFECYAAFRRGLEHACAGTAKLWAIKWGSTFTLQRRASHTVESPNTGIAVLGCWRSR